MFTSFEIDDDLFETAWEMSGIRKKKDLIEELLRVYVRLHEQAQIRSLRGKLVWEGDLEQIRGERNAGSR